MACAGFTPLRWRCGRGRAGVENCSHEESPACKMFVFKVRIVKLLKLSSFWWLGRMPGETRILFSLCGSRDSRKDIRAKPWPVGGV
jgi:hypothetical protein